MSQEKSNMTRRDFVKGAAVTVAAVAGGAVMAGCAPKVVGEESVTPAAGDVATTAAGSSTRLTGFVARVIGWDSTGSCRCGYCQYGGRGCGYYRRRQCWCGGNPGRG